VSVDMHEHSIVSTLSAFPRFTPPTTIDYDVGTVGFPAWRALFTSLLHWGHSTGYRLPSFDEFFLFCAKAYQHPAHNERFVQWFQPDYRKRTEQRFRLFYESGIAEMHLYACLVDAFEDILRDGVVLYDPRIDWKHKSDLLVVTRGAVISVDSFYGSPKKRNDTRELRDEVERIRKVNTAQSSHWGNRERDRWIELRIGRTGDKCENINGLRLFSASSINCLLEEIYTFVGTPEPLFYFPESREDRKQLYRQMIGRAA
jgi:hypothetical protein